jgi:glucosamine--fructose-6-phosphate aminotransferase (isomerizing)
MCGIIGYVGKENNAVDIIYSGLRSLEYRGYDSCGAAIFNKDNAILHWHHLGAPSEVSNIPNAPVFSSSCAIGHTRWATHGEVSLSNAHPHFSSDKKVYLVHNGIIENADQIKEDLKFGGYSETDTEVLANLIAHNLKESSSPINAIKASLTQVEGTYGLAIIFPDEPNKIYAARRSSPLIVGVGKDEYYLASDLNALPPHIEKVSYLDDGNIVSISKDEFILHDLNGQRLKHWAQIKKVKTRNQKSDLGDFSSYLEKEIFEQGDSIRNTTRGRFDKDFSRIVLGGISSDRDIKRVLFLGCGTAYHAGLLGKYYMENIAKIPASVEISSEYRYKNNPTEEGTLVIAISQSGETIDTLSALKEAQNKGLDTIAITNTVLSSIARQVPEGIYQRVGPEISVASTKAFTSQVTLLLMLAIDLGMRNNMSIIEAKKYIKELRCLPELIDSTLEMTRGIVHKIAAGTQMANTATFLGRQYMYPIALESALKVKELAYLSTHGYPSGEIKHGPIAHVEAHSVCIFLAPEKSLKEKNIIAMKEIKARGGRIFLINQKGQRFPEDCYDYLIDLPRARDFILPILSVIPMQLFSLYLAQMKGYNVDRPRNLAKSVTVE